MSNYVYPPFLSAASMARYGDALHQNFTESASPIFTLGPQLTESERITALQNSDVQTNPPASPTPRAKKSSCGNLQQSEKILGYY